jgi:CubicO group peptidase (beta-lactamase class C family)
MKGSQRWRDILVLGALAACVVGLTAQTPAPRAPLDLRTMIDPLAPAVLRTTGAPSASIAVVNGGQVAFVQAYGDARLEPRTAATPTMRYSIGSVSKQFTAAAILLLQEAGKLSLDDKVGKYVPGLARGNDVTIRQLLSHTSGYQDYWPQDYVITGMLRPTTAQQILDVWARRALDFEPGAKWQYSNTNYIIAGLIVDKVAGEPLWSFLGKRVFTPLGMTSVTNIDERALPAADATGYFRYALGPLRPAPKEAPGWLFAAGEIAATATDVAKWDISLMTESLLKPASYRELEGAVRLNNGVSTQYGLGMFVQMANGRRQLEHSGEVSGFTAENIVLPDDGVAVVVLVNQDASNAASSIGRQIALALTDQMAVRDRGRTDVVRHVFDELRAGRIDRSLFTANCNAYFTDQALKDYASSLSALGEILSFSAGATSLRGGMIHRSFSVRFASRSVTISIFEMPDGKFEQFLVI